MDKSKTFEELAQDSVGTIYHESMEDGVSFVVLRGPCSLCAYLGVPKDHPLAGNDYNDLPISCHGGLTYSGEGFKSLAKERYWYGWDYGHGGDRAFYDLVGGWLPGEREWTVDEVVKDSRDAKYEMGKLMKLAERIFDNVQKGKK